MSEVIDRIKTQLRKVQQLDSGSWTACCPAHADHVPSLTVSMGSDGRVLLHCKVGCTFEEIASALGFKPHELMPPREGQRPGKAGKNWRERAEGMAQAITPERRSELARALALPLWALDALPLLGTGCDEQGEFWSFPECGPDGEIVGITRRYTDGSKKAMSGSKRGLTLPTLWRSRPAPLLVVEGPSDTVALTAAGVAAVGRPGNSSGAQLLGELLSGWPQDRGIIVAAENDRKPDGSWPGRDGASRMAVALAGHLARPVGIAMPPDGFKDARQWLTSKAGPDAGLQKWIAAGGDLVSEWLGNDFSLVKWVYPSVEERRRDRPRIQLDRFDLAGTVDRLAEVLADVPDVFTKGGILTQVYPAPRYDQDNRLTVVREAQVLSREVASYLLSDAAIFQQTRGDTVSNCLPPESAVGALLKRTYVDKFRHLRGIVNCPMLLPDGRLVVKDGYDAATGYYVATDGVHLPAVPDRPTLDQAKEAVWKLLDLVDEFPWRSRADQAAWLAYLFTLACRSSFVGATPLFLFDAPAAGSGKSLLVRLATSIAFGQDPGLRSFPAEEFGSEMRIDQTELRKAITSIALSGSPAEVFDNVPQGLSIGGAALDGVLTAGAWKDRILGGNTEATLPWTCVLAATGNNLAVEADTIRRVVPCRIEPEEERPAERGGYRIPDLLAHARAHRPTLLAAALTVVRGYITAGRPNQNLSHFGSFEQWSGIVRAAVRWSMGTDPLDTREGLVTTGGVDEVARLFEALAEIPGISRGLTSRQIVSALKAASANNELEAARDLVGEWAARGGTLPNEVSLGKHLSKFVGRIAGGRQIRVKTDRRNSKVWTLIQVGETPPREGSEPRPHGSEIPEYAEAAF